MALIVVLTGCGVPMFPSRPNTAPIQISARDGELWFRWCGEETGELGGLVISYNVPSAEPNTGVAVRGQGSFVLSRGSEFSLAEPPSGVEYSISGALPSTDGSFRVFVHTGESPDDLSGFEAMFTIRSMDDLTDREWITTAGEPTTTCGAGQA